MIPQFSKSCKGWQRVQPFRKLECNSTCIQFQKCERTECFCGVERVSTLWTSICIASFTTWKRINEMSTLPPPPGKISAEAHISWVTSCNDSLFADMTLTLHLSQVYCSSNMQWWACSSLNPLHCLQRQVAKLGSELFYYWPLLRNNNLATNPRRCAWSHCGRRFAACSHWTETNWQVMQRAR